MPLEIADELPILISNRHRHNLLILEFIVDPFPLNNFLRLVFLIDDLQLSLPVFFVVFPLPIVLNQLVL